MGVMPHSNHYVNFNGNLRFAANEETKKKFSSHVRISISYYEPEKLEKVLEDFSSAVIETLSSKGQLHA